MARDQLALFGGPPLPEGFRYHTDVITPAEELELLERIAPLPFREFEFQGYLGKRRVVSYGWRYDFNEKTLRKADDMPPFLRDLRAVAARFAEVDPSALQQALVSEYAPGAGIGWHRDKAMFGDVIGISLHSACTLRLRRRTGPRKWARAAITAEPRSAYLLRGPSRTDWEHSIPPVSELRYSITFRNFLEEG